MLKGQNIIITSSFKSQVKHQTVWINIFLGIVRTLKSMKIQVARYCPSQRSECAEIIVFIFVFGHYSVGGLNTEFCSSGDLNTYQQIQ